MIETIRNILRSYIGTVWKKQFIFILFFWIFVSFITVIEPLIFTQIIKQIENFYITWEFDFNATSKLIIFWGIFILFSIIIQYIYRYYLVWKSTLQNYVEECNKYTKIVISMNYSDFLSKKQGSIYKILDRWTDNHVEFMHFFFSEFTKNITWIFIIIFILLYVDFKMTLVVLVMLPIMLWMWIFFMNKVTPTQMKITDKWDNVFWTIWNLLSWFMLTKTLTLESKYIKNIKNRLSSIHREQLQVSKLWSIANIYTATIVMISRILVLWFWVYYVINWSLSFANLFLFFAYIWWIYFPLWFIFWRLEVLNKQLASIKKLHSEFDNLELEDIKTWKPVKNLKWFIEYSWVKFWYIKWKKIFKNLSFKINAWEKIAFVWNTWAWKSTLISLLLKFWELDSWSILIDWNNIKNISKKSLRNHIWVVTQDISLFNDTVLNNLLFAKPKATKKEIQNALKKAEANFVLDFEKWLNTVIWERWLKLSWWEKQRLSIARLFLKNPKILILDEATSALDNKTEKLIQKALDKLMKWRTSIVIAHRLSTIQNADKIFMLENGKIVESWKYDELMINHDKFYELANPDNLILN